MNKEIKKLSNKDIYCMARIIQSAVFAKGQIFYGCQFCKYCEDGCKQALENKGEGFHYDVIMKKLQQITGLNMSIRTGNLLEKFKEPSTSQ